MSDLTGELQRMADHAARQARPLAAADVIRRGDRRRRLSVARQYLGGLSVAVVIAAVILAVTAALPSSYQPSAQLTAWTVTKQADGTISVTIRELSDAAGLEHSLRADGVPATVTFDNQPNPSCRALSAVPWTVTKRADGKISVTVSELSDAAGLEHSLRADGIPATVTFDNQQNPSCKALRAFPSHR